MALYVHTHTHTHTQLKLSAASPNSPQVGGFFGGGYLGANEDHAAVAANVQVLICFFSLSFFLNEDHAAVAANVQVLMCP